ncbi:MAG: glycosyltransferase [Bacteroidetes bacterium]|nr:glycosyltransferase [Bacteroidota bacterium]
MKKVLVITEDISKPIDEGVKKFSFYLVKFFDSSPGEALIFSRTTNEDVTEIHSLPGNRLFFSFSFFSKISKFRPEALVYVPASSSTMMSFIRLAIITSVSRVRFSIMISVQERRHSSLAKRIIRLLKPDQLVVLSRKEADYYEKLGMNCIASPVGVNTDKFFEVSTEQQIAIRKKLQLPLESKIALHVGHIKRGRNLELLKGLLEIGYQVVVIVSTRFESDNELKTELENAGYRFITDYIESIQEYYQACDIYVFPVESATNAMEFPASVLEAMSCNKPVLTTHFGGIDSFLFETNWFKYFDSEKELLDKAAIFEKHPKCENRQLILEQFSWNGVYKNLFIKNKLI